MSHGQLSQHNSRSTTSKHSYASRHTPPPNSLTPENVDPILEPCAATGAYLLYAQRNTILVLHHDTLAIERRFEGHHEDVRWIVVDNASERGAGRLAVSYDAGNTCVTWDILTGGEVARFAAYEPINVASFMRNGNVAFGNAQGSVTLFEPSTSEHISTRTIYDPITAIAPATDCRTFAIGYLNGSILVATLQPAFTILHTLTTSRAPSRITGLSWHGSSSKQKTDMLATQTAEGDLRVWSVPKTGHQDSPTIIRVLGRPELQPAGLCWFAWSKNGRIVQHVEGETRSWDVRTKKVTYDVIPTIDGIIGISNYGPTATLFTLGRNYTAQQYDITPNSMPLQVQNVQHVPANTPPTPPTNLEEQKNSRNGPQDHQSTDAPRFVVLTDAESSADEGAAMSPLQKIALEMDSLDQLESEVRDKVMPLSPVSSRASSVSSRSSQGGRRQQKYLYDQPSSSRASSQTGYDGTEFSFGGPSVRQSQDNMSIRSGSTRASRMSNSRPRTSALRKEILRSPEESKDTAMMDLFAFTKARLRDLPFKTPNYGHVARTPELLQREMLKVVFGWSDNITNLVREEMRRHRPGSASVIMLAKWLGDMGADSMASMIGSESMTSSDWMLLALSSIGQDSQKKVGEAFVQRLLEKGDIHPAVAILLGLGEHNDAIEVYVSQGYHMEAVILTCLTCPADWGRQSFLLRKWGEVAVQNGQPELAVRIFSCASVEMSEPWFSPRAQDAVYAAQQARLTDPPSAGLGNSPPLSPPSVTGSGRLTARNASLKLITSFGAKGAPLTADDPTPLAVAATPIAESAISPRGGGFSRLRPGESSIRDPSEARTATPGGFARKKRLPSKSDIARAKQDAAEMATPLTAARDQGSRTRSRTGSRQRGTSSVRSIPEPATALGPSVYNPNGNDSGSDNEMSLPPPSHDMFRKRTEGSRKRTSREKKPEGLMVDIVDTRLTADVYSAGPSTHDTVSTSNSVAREQTRAAALSPPLTGTSLRNAKNKAIDAYISSVEEARVAKRQERASSRARAESQSRHGRMRAESRTSRASSRARDRSEEPRLDGTYYVQPGKRSPSSPVPMSPEEIAQASVKQAETAATDAEAFYKIASPIEPRNSGGLSELLHDRRWSGDDAPSSTFASRTHARARSPDRDRLQVSDERGRGDERGSGSASRSPSSPLPLLPDTMRRQDNDTQSDGRRIFVRSQNSAKHKQDLQARRAAGRNRSTSRRPKPRDDVNDTIPEVVGGSDTEDMAESQRRPRAFTRKQLAAKELEDRRLSLARRPSAPVIPTPAELTPGRPRMSPRYHTDLGNSPHSFMPPLSRSATVDPDAMARYGKTTGTSTTSAPIGLPATPRAMRHPRYMSADPDRDAPPVPDLPDNLSSLSGSNLSQLTGSALSQMASSSLSQAAPSSLSQMSSVLSEPPNGDAEADSVGPLLPSTVFGMKGPQGPVRSASAPPEKLMGHQVHHAYNMNLPTSNKRLSGGRGHVRKISPPSLNNIDQPEISSIDQALYSATFSDQDIIIVPEEEPQGPPIMLPQLQHLAGPPPPPPPPTMFQPMQPEEAGVINVAVGGDDEYSGEAPDLSETPTSFPQSFPQPMSRAQTVSPSMHRSHRRGSASTSDTFGSRMRGVAEKMRSSSRSRGMNQLPTLEPYTFKTPYETVLPSMPSGHSRKSSISRAKSPYEQAMADQKMQMPPPPPPAPAPPAAGEEYRFTETVVPPRSQSAMGGGYRNPKEIRANMPPSHLQPGVYTPLQGGFL